MIGPAVLEKKMFEIVYDDDDDDDDGRRTTDDGRRLDGYTISSPCEPNGSGELKTRHETPTPKIFSKDYTKTTALQRSVASKLPGNKHLALICEAVLVEKLFEMVDGRTDGRRRTPYHGYTISSHGEPVTQIS